MASLLYNIYMILLFFAGISAAGQPVSDMAGLQSGREDRTTYADAMKFEDRELSKNGDDVTLSMKIILDSTRIRTQHTITLTPVLISADSTEECDFGAVIIDGRARHRVFLRKEALEKEDDSVRNSAIAVIMRKNGSAQEYTYMSSVPYHRWMLGGRVELRESVSGCAECGEGTSEHVMEDPVLQEFIPVWKTSRIAPEPEPVKRRQEHRIKYCVIGILYSIYLAGMLHFTLLHRVILDTRHIKFFSLNTGVSIYDMSETFYNIFLFIPMGFLTPLCFKNIRLKRILFQCLCISFGIEIIQLIFQIGFFDINDLVNNVLGGMIGYSTFLLIKTFLIYKMRKNLK